MLKILLDNNYKEFIMKNKKQYKKLNNLSKDKLKKYNIDVESIKKTYYEFQNKFKHFIKISVNDKIYVDEQDIIQLDKYSYMQSVKRWYYSNNRYNSIEKLEKNIDDLFIFKNMLSECFLQNFNYCKMEIISILLDVNKLFKSILDSVGILLETYKNDKEISKKIKEIRYEIQNYLTKCKHI